MLRCQDEEPGIIIDIPLEYRRRSGRKEIVLPNDDAHLSGTGRPSFQESLVITLAKVHRWKRLIEDGKFGSISDIARAVGLDPSFAARLMKLTHLAPDIVECILRREEPDGLSLKILTKRIPTLWTDQRRLFGFKEP